MHHREQSNDPGSENPNQQILLEQQDETYYDRNQKTRAGPKQKALKPLHNPFKEDQFSQSRD
jgi:hypothetical protein